jgi:nitrite transporter NirC
MFTEEFATVILAAQKKIKLLRTNPAGYFLAALLAGFYVGLGIILIFSIGGQLSASGTPWIKVIMGVSFGIALSLVIMAGAELFTGNVLVMSAGLLRKSIRWADAGYLLLISYLGNLTGSVLVAWLYHMTGLGAGPVGEFIAKASAVKMALPAGQLIFRGILCNILVCLAVWCTFRLKEETARLIMIFWCLFAFITSGFEHSIANMTLLAIALLNPGAAAVSAGGYVYNVLLSSLGNILGAVLFLALPYATISRTTKEA